MFVLTKMKDSHQPSVVIVTYQSVVLMKQYDETLCYSQNSVFIAQVVSWQTQISYLVPSNCVSSFVEMMQTVLTAIHVLATIDLVTLCYAVFLICLVTVDQMGKPGTLCCKVSVVHSLQQNMQCVKDYPFIPLVIKLRDCQQGSLHC